MPTDLPGSVELRLAADAAPGDLLPTLARLLRGLRDLQPPDHAHSQAAAKETSHPPGG